MWTTESNSRVGVCIRIRYRRNSMFPTATRISIRSSWVAVIARFTARLWSAMLSGRRSSLLMPPRGTAVLVMSPAPPWLHLPGAGNRSIFTFHSRVSLHFGSAVFFLSLEQCSAKTNFKWSLSWSLPILTTVVAFDTFGLFVREDSHVAWCQQLLRQDVWENGVRTVPADTVTASGCVSIYASTKKHIELERKKQSVTHIREFS